MTYYFRVTSADASSNCTTEPVDLPLSTLRCRLVPAPVNIIAADFTAGTADANTMVISEGDGAVKSEAIAV